MLQTQVTQALVNSCQLFLISLISYFESVRNSEAEVREVVHLLIVSSHWLLTAALKKKANMLVSRHRCVQLDSMSIVPITYMGEAVRLQG